MTVSLKSVLKFFSKKNLKFGLLGFLGCFVTKKQKPRIYNPFLQPWYRQRDRRSLYRGSFPLVLHSVRRIGLFHSVSITRSTCSKLLCALLYRRIIYLLFCHHYCFCYFAEVSVSLFATSRELFIALTMNAVPGLQYIHYHAYIYRHIRNVRIAQ